MKKLLIIIGLLCSFSVLAESGNLLILGDSLSAGYGIAIEDSWVSLLQHRLTEKDYNYKVINASITGDTSRSALQRLDKLLEKYKPEITIIELGGNDGLRGLQLEEVRQNLAEIISLLNENSSRVLLIPMELPPNYGQVYNENLKEIYQELAEVNGLVPARFILDGIGDQPDLMQKDGIHPRAEAQAGMLDNIWPALETLL